MKKITIEDLLKFRFIENLSFDPSGKNCAYSLVHIDKKKDAYFKSVCINKKTFKSDKNTSILGWYDASHLIIQEISSPHLWTSHRSKSSMKIPWSLHPSSMPMRQTPANIPKRNCRNTRTNSKRKLTMKFSMRSLTGSTAPVSKTRSATPYSFVT